jgi:hypothetical protein
VLQLIQRPVVDVPLEQAHDATEARLRHSTQADRRAAVPLDELRVIPTQGLLPKSKM